MDIEEILGQFTENELDKAVNYKEFIMVLGYMLDAIKSFKEEEGKANDDVFDTLIKKLTEMNYKIERNASFTRAAISSMTGMSQSDVLRNFDDFCQKFDEINKK